MMGRQSRRVREHLGHRGCRPARPRALVEGDDVVVDGVGDQHRGAQKLGQAGEVVDAVGADGEGAAGAGVGGEGAGDEAVGAVGVAADNDGDGDAGGEAVVDDGLQRRLNRR